FTSCGSSREPAIFAPRRSSAPCGRSRRPISSSASFRRRCHTSASPLFDPQELVQAAGDAIIAAGADGSIVFWNPAAERIFGYAESEALGRSLDLIIPERFRHRHWDGYRQVMQTGHTKYGTEVLRVAALHKDGRTLSIAFTVALLRAPGDGA